LGFAGSNKLGKVIVGNAPLLKFGQGPAYNGFGTVDTLARKGQCQKRKLTGQFKGRVVSTSLNG